MDFGDDFWAGVAIAAGVATAIATSLALLMTVWWRRVDQARAELTAYQVDSSWTAGTQFSPAVSPRAYGKLGNVGPGPAFRVEAAGLGCSLRVWRENESGAPLILVPVLVTGAGLKFIAECEPNLWSQAEVVLTWREPSIWRPRPKRRIKRLPLRDMVARPSYTTFVQGKPVTGSVEEPQPPVLPKSSQEQLQPPVGSWLARELWWQRLRRRGACSQPQV